MPQHMVLVVVICAIVGLIMKTQANLIRVTTSLEIHVQQTMEVLWNLTADR